MVLLDFYDRSADSLLFQPRTEFRKIYFGKAVFGLHGLLYGIGLNICKS